MLRSSQWCVRLGILHGRRDGGGQRLWQVPQASRPQRRPGVCRPPELHAAGQLGSQVAGAAVGTVNLQRTKGAAGPGQ